MHTIHYTLKVAMPTDHHSTEAGLCAIESLAKWHSEGRADTFQVVVSDDGRHVSFTNFESGTWQMGFNKMLIFEIIANHIAAGAQVMGSVKGVTRYAPRTFLTFDICCMGLEKPPAADCITEFWLSDVQYSKTGIKCHEVSAVSELLHFDDGLEHIAAGAVAHNDTLCEIRFPASLKTVGADAFRDCIRLERLVFPDSVTHIHRQAMMGCAALFEVHLPAALERIEERTFSGCRMLDFVSIPATVRRIDDCAFEHCASLRTIHLGVEDPALIELHYDAFRGVPLDKVKLYVPRGSADLYRKHRFFSQFAVVLER